MSAPDEYADRPTPITDAEWQTQCCSGASWYRIAEKMKNRAADLERKLTEALEWKRMLSIWGGTPEIVDSFIKGQQERIAAAQEAENQRDELALCAIELASYANESLPQNQPEFLEGLFERVKKYGDAHFRVYGTYETSKGGEG